MLKKNDVFNNKNNIEDSNWMDILNNDEYLARQDINDVEDIIIRQDKEYDFNVLHHNYDDFNINEIKAKYNKVIKSNRITNRRSVHSSSLNKCQKYAHNMIIRALNLDVN